MAAKRKSNKTAGQGRIDVLRILDANYNRAKEAMRVCEDIVRFSVEDKNLTLRWKKIRHELSQSLVSFPRKYQALLESRKALGDVGNKSVIQDKRKGLSGADLLIANAKRSQEAVRVLEEFGKIACPKQIHTFQRIRFRLYDLEKQSVKQI